MEIDKGKGIRAGLICFTAFMVPWLFLTFMALTTAPESFRGQNIIDFCVGIFIFIFVSAFLGFSIARKSKLLKILSYLLVAAVPITWGILFIYSNFIE